MPATKLFGCRLRQLANDNFVFYALAAVVQVRHVACIVGERCRKRTAPCGGHRLAAAASAAAWLLALHPRPPPQHKPWCHTSTLPFLLRVITL